ncbi:hypothetical protein KJ934_02210 [Patescibacteria group bacterium]|nr:hypothetical protein [Patescibacteria group bacterium]MBU4353391.1 hypothetical protein [Patescibacteria group bacterium]MBU4477281.1 hypothetical protein [Patescibacteria group bacterium]MCG2699206.1 hypothetical protein [Candidatus Parcubacteria bacterium]
METFVVNVGIFALVVFFLVFVYLVPLTSGYVIAILYIAKHGIANYYFMLDGLLIVVVAIVCAVPLAFDKLTFNERFDALDAISFK